jgi:hypothetical protein
VAGESGTDLRTALVVLATPPAGPGGYTTAARPPASPEGAELVRKWFADRGFDVDPVVGIAFSISGPATLFDATFGPTGPGAVELDAAALAGRLDAGLLRYVAAVAIGPPPDFGPTNF